MVENRPFRSRIGHYQDSRSKNEFSMLQIENQYPRSKLISFLKSRAKKTHWSLSVEPAVARTPSYPFKTCLHRARPGQVLDSLYSRSAQATSPWENAVNVLETASTSTLKKASGDAARCNSGVAGGIRSAHAGTEEVVHLPCLGCEAGEDAGREGRKVCPSDLERPRVQRTCRLSPVAARRLHQIALLALICEISASTGM
jgi:hypothetical protein